MVTNLLKELNALRATRGSPPLELGSSIKNYSQEWANYLTKNDIVKYRQRNRFGGQEMILKLNNDGTKKIVSKSNPPFVVELPEIREILKIVL